MNEYKSFKSWEKIKILGSGGFGEVLLWRNRVTQLEIATKSLKRNNSLAEDEERKLKNRWQQEFDFSRDINTDSIVRGIDLEDKKFVSYLNENHAYSPLPVLITEYCNGGDLRRQLSKFENINGLVEYQVREVLRSLRNAVDYLHNNCRIKHRDLKPDNIVIQRTADGKVIYKITDFGFARFINDETMLQSVVGTRNYIAPEIVDTAEYTNTVDYWSVGIIAFEILCGILPFIAHQSLFMIITNIKKKAYSCIAITEDVEKPNNFINHNAIFNENRVSSCFRKDIENWLRLALNIDYRSRGIALAGVNEIPNAPGGRIKKFFTGLDIILESRVLTMYCLRNNTFYEFKIDENTNIREICDELAERGGIALTSQYFIRPTGHPLKHNTAKAIDYFVDEWQDTTKKDNPPAMIFVADAAGNFDAGEAQVPEIVKYWIINQNNKLPLWVMEKFARGLQFLLTNEQRHLNALLQGFMNYALNVEEEIMNFEDEIKTVATLANILQGRIEQFSITVQGDTQTANSLSPTLSTSYQNWLTSWRRRAAEYNEFIDKIQNQVVPKLSMRYRSMLRRIREQLQNTFAKECIEKDIYEIGKFCKHLANSQHLAYKPNALNELTSLCEYCKETVLNCLKTRGEFFNSTKFKSMRTEISGIHYEFLEAKEIARNATKICDEKCKRITFDTKSCNISLIQLFAFTHNEMTTKQNHVILISDGNENSTHSMKMIHNGLEMLSLADIMQKDTSTLLNETVALMELFSIDQRILK